MALQRLGPFELLRVLGRGGMGTVYEAREAGSSDVVAVKALSPAFSFDEHFRNRFEGEIDALMSLDHQNIVRLLSYGQDEGNLFFAMELVDGSSLFQEQKRGQVFHWHDIINIGIQVCNGLRHAHDRGIIHRDLKPGNLMIDKDRNVKITDFGIAKSFGSSSLTSEGNVLGTMDFMAPEQARGSGTTVRSDLFSLGAVLYSLLAGRPPFLQKTVEKTFEALLSSAPPDRLDRIAPDIPKPLSQLIHRLLEKDVSRRIATAQATCRQLEHVREVVKTDPKRETQVVSTDTGQLDDGDTRELTGKVTGQIEVGNTSANRESQYRQTAAGDDPDTSVVAVNDGNPPTAEFQTRQPDYFNQVTPQQRQKKSTLTQEENSGSVWPVLFALLAVLAISAAGIWFALFRKPSKETLLATIKKHEAYPVKVQEEIKSFIKWFPEAVELPYIEELQGQVEVLRYRNTLRTRRNPASNNPLSQIEQKFLEVAELAKDNVPLALDRLESFLSVYGASETASEQDNRAIAMARKMKPRLTHVAQFKIIEGLGFIEASLKRGRATRNRSDAMKTFDSIIDIYGDGQHPWADELIQQARDELEKLKDQ